MLSLSWIIMNYSMRDWVCAKMLLIIIHVITYIMHELTGSGHCNFIWIVQCSLKVLLISTVKILVVFIKLWKATWEREWEYEQERETDILIDNNWKLCGVHCIFFKIYYNQRLTFSSILHTICFIFVV